MTIKLIRIKNDLLKKLRKFSKFKEILEIFENFEKFDQILKKYFEMSIFAYYFQIIFLTNYVSDSTGSWLPLFRNATTPALSKRTHVLLRPTPRNGPILEPRRSVGSLGIPLESDARRRVGIVKLIGRRTPQTLTKTLNFKKHYSIFFFLG